MNIITLPPIFCLKDGLHHRKCYVHFSVAYAVDGSTSRTTHKEGAHTIPRFLRTIKYSGILLAKPFKKS